MVLFLSCVSPVTCTEYSPRGWHAFLILCIFAVDN
jgi:hypothetical protein